MKDITYIQKYIDNICGGKANPSVLTRKQPTISLLYYVSKYSISPYIIQTLYNKFTGKFIINASRKDIVKYEHIAYAFAVNDDLLKQVISAVRELPNSNAIVDKVNLMYNDKLIVEPSMIIPIIQMMNSSEEYQQELLTVKTYKDMLALLLNYNDFGDRRSDYEEILNSDIIDANNIYKAIRLVTNDEYVLFEISRLDKRRYDIIIDEHKSVPLHTQCRTNIQGIMDQLYSVYSTFKGMTNANNKPFTHIIILGAITFAQLHSGIDITKLALSASITRHSMRIIRQIFHSMRYFEPEMSPIHITLPSIIDGYKEYYDNLGLKCSNPTFYTDTLSLLYAMDTNSDDMQDFVMYDARLETERIIMQPKKPISLIDTINNAYTSPDMPFIAIHDGINTVFKLYNNTNKSPEWVIKMHPFTMRIVVRISKIPNRYQILEYNSLNNTFMFLRAEKYIPLDTMINIICKHLSLTTMNIPISSSYTYSFITNFISDENQENGIDRSVLSWLITNPPPEYVTKMNNIIDYSSGEPRSAKVYSGPCLDSYVFIKEDNKPDAHKKHINIHVQIGTEKMYMSISTNETSSKLVARHTVDVGDYKYVGLEQGQSFFRIRINKCPSIHHARICQHIYRNIIYMYLKYYKDIKEFIDKEILPPSALNDAKRMIIPRVSKLITVQPSIKDIYSTFDSKLYSHLPTGSEEHLPIPIDRDSIDLWKNKGYSIIKLPTIVLDDPTITFETMGEIWLRTKKPNTAFGLREKVKSQRVSNITNISDLTKNEIDHGYIPLELDGKNNILPIYVNNDMSINLSKSKTSGAYVLRSNKKITILGQKGIVSDMISHIISSIIDTNDPISRLGISNDMIHTFNHYIKPIEANRLTSNDVSKFANLCMQECWNQSPEDIMTDIDMGKISIYKHYRAFEAAYQINIYFMIDDIVEPYMLKPPYAHFYIHRRGNPKWPCVVFLIRVDSPSKPDLIVTTKNSINTALLKNAKMNPVYSFDTMMDKVNITNIISPAENKNIVIRDISIPHYANWKPYKQVIDSFGKCRAIIYSHISGGKTEYATINIIFSAILNEYPITKEIVNPTMRMAYIKSKGNMMVPAIIADNPNLPILSELIMYKNSNSSFEEWKILDKSAYLLRMITHMLYSSSNESLDIFINRIIVDPTHMGIYETGILPSSMIDTIIGKISLWKFFETYTAPIEDDMNTGSKLMIRDGKIYVKSFETKRALRYFMMATSKLIAQVSFPGYIRYSWDIKNHSDESVYLDTFDVINNMVLEKLPSITNDIVISTIPYIIERGREKYLVQMIRKENDLKQAMYIAIIWNQKKVNPGYSCIYPNSNDFYQDYELPMVNSNFIKNSNTYSYTESNERIFLLIKLS